jgi:hypothetical protein
MKRYSSDNLHFIGIIQFGIMIYIYMVFVLFIKFVLVKKLLNFIYLFNFLGFDVISFFIKKISYFVRDLNL